MELVPQGSCAEPRVAGPNGDMVENKRPGSLLVKSVDKKSKMYGKLYPGDQIMEVQGAQISNMEVWNIYFFHGATLLVQRKK